MFQGLSTKEQFNQFGAYWDIFRHRNDDTFALQTRILADKHTFLSIVISVFRRYEKPTKKVLAQSEKLRYGFWIPIYLPSITSDV